MARDNGKLGVFLIALVMLSAGFAYLGAVRRSDHLGRHRVTKPEPHTRGMATRPETVGPALFDFQADDEHDVTAK